MFQQKYRGSGDGRRIGYMFFQLIPLLNYITQIGDISLFDVHTGNMRRLPFIES